MFGANVENRIPFIQYSRQGSWRLHAIIVSQSPYLAQLLVAAQTDDRNMLRIDPRLELYPEVTIEVRCFMLFRYTMLLTNFPGIPRR